MAAYSGSCHCGGVTFKIDTNETLGPYFRCDCSLCRRKGTVMGASRRDSLTITAGQDLLSIYKWNTNTAHHYFCKVCGIYTHHVMRVDPERIGINMGCIEGMEPCDMGDVLLWEGRQLSSED